MKAKRLPSQERLRKLFDYSNGVLLWRRREDRTRFDRTWNARYAGKVAGSLMSSGYRGVSLGGGDYLLHRLIWAWHHGDLPERAEIDHKDRNRDNNQIDNLRVATKSNNMQNAACRSDSQSGLKGAHHHRASGRWSSFIRVNGRRISLGYFDTPMEAHEAYAAAARHHFGEFARAV